MKRRSGASKPLVLLGAAVLVCAGSSAYMITKCGTPEPRGTWRDVNDKSYYIQFLEDSTYKESTYGRQMPYRVSGDHVVFECLDGTTTTSALTSNFGKRVAVLMNGVERVMEPTKEVPKFDTHHSEASELLAKYKLMQGWEGAPVLNLYNDSSFVLDGLEEPCEGKYSIGEDGLTLYYGDGDETWRSWANGFVAERVETSLHYEVVKANPIDDRGLKLDGTVYIPESCVTYNFLPNNTVTRTSNTGEKVDFVYFADTTGLITMSDLVGQGVRDYLWLDVTNGDVYRYVYKNDEWFQYIKDLGVSQ